MQIVDVTTFTKDSDDAEATRQIDLAVKSDREWLYKHIMWALNNERDVHCEPVVDSDAD
jgi:hypothetical protein